MKNDYISSSLDLDVYLEGSETIRLKEEPIECELTESGTPLGRKLIVEYDGGIEDDKRMDDDSVGEIDWKNIGVKREFTGDGIKVEYLKSEPGGWEKTIAIKVTLNEQGYSTLIKRGKVGSRHALGAHISIITPGSYIPFVD